MEACKTDQQICLPDSKQPRVVIIGGGFAGIALAKKLKLTFIGIFLDVKTAFANFDRHLSLPLQAEDSPLQRRLIDAGMHPNIV